MKAGDNIKALVQVAREACGCLACSGPMPAGEHTIAGNKPRSTPSSCLAATILERLMRDGA